MKNYNNETEIFEMYILFTFAFSDNISYRSIHLFNFGGIIFTYTIQAQSIY